MLFGDVCHFIDLAIWFQRSLPLEVHAFATRDPGHGEESWMIQLRFANGGLSTVHYVCGSQQGFVGETDRYPRRRPIGAHFRVSQAGAK